MARGGAGRRRSLALAALAGLALLAPEARAIEFFDGRIQIHGFGEVQVRAIAQGYERDLDLVQWYNVFNVELETDILPDGWGPFDLLQSYVRVEVRYDCVWTRGCGTMRSADSFGNRAKKLPHRIADAVDEDYGGAIGANAESEPPGTPPRNPHENRVSPLGVFETLQNPECVFPQLPGQSPHFCFDPNLPLSPQNRPSRLAVRKREGFPGFDTLADLEGADAILGPNQFQGGTNDDPFEYLFAPINDFRFTFRDKRGPLGGTGRTLIMGPWLPKNTVKALAVLEDRGNPFRGGRTPTANGLIGYSAAGQTQPRQNDRFSYRWTELDDQRRAFFFFPGSQSLPPPCSAADPTCVVPGPPEPDLPYPFDPVDPRIAFDSDGDGRFDSGQAFSVLMPDPAGFGPYPNSRFVFSLANEPLVPVPQVTQLPFGGDYTGIIPCNPPDTGAASLAQGQINSGTGPGCWTNVEIPGAPTRGLNLANAGGRGELPFRPAPDLSNLEGFQVGAAQGLYYPSPGLRQALAEVGGDFDNHFFNFTQSERAWNRGYSQYYTKEFKEGYLDMEFLDSRLWLRIGKQNIVWGKTELFRTTDQFNPQDLALASLPSLEESRTALFAVRAVYSFYDVGPLQDLRLELAANFDHVTAADLGACGEPFTPDVVCGLTTGLEFHGLTGAGIAGVDRPPNPWDDIKGLEFGGRVEFRWSIFSFAIADFYGYSDFPHPDPINFYERNVDTVSGRPLVAEPLRGPVNTGRCRNGVPSFVRAAQLQYFFGANNLPFPVGAVPESGDPNHTPPGSVPYWNALSPMMGGLGAGTDPDCLKPGGATGFPNANRLNDITPVDIDGDGVPDPTWNAPALGDPAAGIPANYSPQNALEFQSANQGLFAFVCLGTVTIAASLDGSSCSWTIFGSPSPFAGAFSETFSTIFAGDPDQRIAGLFNPIVTPGAAPLLVVIQQNQKGIFESPVPIRPTNRDLRDGVMTSLDPIFNRDGVPYNPDSMADLLSLDSVLTAEQRALLGCGPFYGTRCDNAARDRNVGFPEGGGIDFLNTEASALVQSWPGVEGTSDGWTTTQQSLIQPGTIGFPNQAYCTRYSPGDPLANDLGLIRLPGCRGILELLTPRLPDGTLDLPNDQAPIEFLFEQGYKPEQDGCVLGVSKPNDPASRGMGIAGHPVVAKRLRSRDDPDFDPNDPVGSAEDITAALNQTCGGLGAGTATGPIASSTRIPTPNVPAYAASSVFRAFAQTLWHPLAGCWQNPQDVGTPCEFWPFAAGSLPPIFPPMTGRDFEKEFLEGTAQIFRNEMAAFSWNFLMFLVVATCDSVRGGDDLSDPDCFNAAQAWAPDRCSLAAPHFCRNVKGFLSVAGLQRDTVLAGGHPGFGRRDFIWHSGGELVLEYARRNVFGLSADWAEDVTKTNWGLEFTWFSDIPFLNNDDFYNVSDSQVLNLTISVDRPTFINFLNANRTFFINTQWFFQYLTDYQGGGFNVNGPFNVLFTFAVFTGYFQDRLMPNYVFVYDFGSRSGGFLPSLAYRFTENFSVTIGFNYFFGRGQLKSMPVRGFAPASNRAGENAYRDGVENILAPIRHRDEVFFRLRYTF